MSGRSSKAKSKTKTQRAPKASTSPLLEDSDFSPSSAPAPEPLEAKAPRVRIGRPAAASNKNDVVKSIITGVIDILADEELDEKTLRHGVKISLKRLGEAVAHL